MALMAQEVLPASIAWTLPPGVSAGDILWPLPKKLPPAEVTYVEKQPSLEDIFFAVVGDPK